MRRIELLIAMIMIVGFISIGFVVVTNPKDSEASYPDLVKRMEIYKQDYPEYAKFIDYENDTFRDEFCRFNDEQCFHEPFQTEANSQLDALYPMPTDFVDMKSMLKRGLIKYSSEHITENYWLQPEWESGYENIVSAVKDYELGRYAMWCVFSYPSTHVIEIHKTNNTEKIETVTMPVWLKSMAMTDRIVGFYLNPVYPEYEKFQGSSGVPYNRFEVNQDPRIAEQYINLTMNPSGNVLLGPNFPVYHVASDPKYKVQLNMKFDISHNIPVGDYVVGVDFVAPDKDFSEEQYLRYTQRRYVDPHSGIISCNARGFRFFVRVYEA